MDAVEVGVGAMDVGAGAVCGESVFCMVVVVVVGVVLVPAAGVLVLLALGAVMTLADGAMVFTSWSSCCCRAFVTR